MSYWDALAAAHERLAIGDLNGAEAAFVAAWDERERSPGRVFLSETVTDAARRLWGRARGETAESRAAGRWPAAAAAFRAEYQARAAAAVAEALLRCAEQPVPPSTPVPPAPESVALYATALRLVTSSRLFPPDAVAGARLLQAAVMAARRAGQPLDPVLIRADLPLAEADRLALAEQAEVWLDGLAATGAASGAERAALAHAVLRLLERGRFSPGGPFQAERGWREALLTDRHAGAPAAAIPLYRAVLTAADGPRARSDAARVRLIELLANLDAQHLDVPRHEEAQALAMAGPVSDAEGARRLSVARRALERRRPLGTVETVWASQAMSAHGLACVLWWGEEPRDVAYWRPGDDAELLQRFLKPAQGRHVRRERAASGLWAGLGGTAAGAPVEPFAEALLEPLLPAAGLSPELVSRLARERTVAWRRGWDAEIGHPLLVPSSSVDGLLAPEAEPELASALEAGLLWLVCLDRVREADPRVAGGVRRLAGRGDRAAICLARFLGEAPDEGPQAGRSDSIDGWNVPPLHARRDPVFPVAPAAGAPEPVLPAAGAIVVPTARPAAALGAWSETACSWRLVLDREERWPELSAALPNRRGVTLIPPSGLVHAVRPALAWLQRQGAGSGEAGADAEPDLLPLFSWLCLAECHNGDLGEHACLRPRRPGAVPVADRHGALVATWPRVVPGAADADDPWAGEYAQRARGSWLVAGPPSCLTLPDVALDALWGVRDGDDASWVFADSARVHWQLLREGVVDPAGLHTRLARRGRRHVSLVGEGLFLGADLAALLADWLEAFGPFVAFPAGEGGCARLALACGGIAPDARELVAEAGAGGIEHVVRRATAGERPVVLLPEGSRPAALWRAFAAGRLRLDQTDGLVECIEPADLWSERRAPALLVGARLVVPVLASLDAAATPPGSDTVAAWSAADRQRLAALIRERRLCSLEVNALLATGAAVIDVADPRWQRRFPLPQGEGAAGLPSAGGGAVACAAGPLARGYDLPRLDAVVDAKRGGRRRRAESCARLDQVAAWCRAQEEAAGRPGGAAVGDRSSQPEAPARGLRLLAGAGEREWRQACRAVAVARECGDTEAWLLAVGPRPPGDAALLLAAHPTAAPTVLTPADSPWPRPPFGPLLWMPPETLADPALRGLLASRPPLAAFASGLESWLPGPDRPQWASAVALHFLVRDLPRADFCLGSLPGPWQRAMAGFIAEAGGAGNLERGDEGVAAKLALCAGDSVEVPCPDCGAAVPLVGAGPVCPACGLDLDTWQGTDAATARARGVLRARLTALSRRVSDRREDLTVVVSQEQYPIVIELLEEMGLSGGGTGEGAASAQPSRFWTVQPEGTVAAPAVAERIVRLGLDGWPGRGGTVDAAAGDAPVACVHADDLDADWRPGGAERAVRCLRLLALVAGRERPAWARGCRGLLPTDVVKALAGLTAGDVAACLADLAWLTVLETGRVPQTTGSAATGGRRLRLALPLAELEYRLQRSAELAAGWLTTWLEGAPQGLPVACDLATTVAVADEEDVAWGDRFLLACSLRLRAGTAARPGSDLFRGYTGAEELLWSAPEGLVFTSRRLVGTLGQPRAVAERLAHEADRFLAGARALLSEAAFDAAGAWVDLDSRIARSSPVIVTGCLLGAWWLEGEPGPDEFDASPFVWLVAASAMAGARAIDLFADRDAERKRAQALARTALAANATVVSESTCAAPPATAAGRGRGAARAAGPSGEAWRQVASLLAAPAPGLLVLRGCAGTGRLEAVTAALAEAARTEVVRPADAVVWCPTTAVAARVHLTWRRDVDAEVAPRLYVAPDGTPVAGAGPPSGRHLPADPAGELALLVGAEGVPQATRFAVWQRYHRGRMLATVDPAAAEEPWEHLFVTTPRQAAVVDCVDQCVQTRRVWEETRRCAAGPDGRPLRGRPLRRERGEAVAHGAASLDECVALLGAEEAAGRLGRRSAVVAATRADLLYVGRSLAGRGWLPVVRWELDALLLPGALEFVAVVSDVAAAAGEADAAHALLLPPVLGPAAREAYARWHAGAAALARAPLSELYGRIARSGWAASWLAWPEARRRVERLVREAGAETPARFVRRPLWAAWRLELADWLAVPAATPRAPVVTLATPETCGATGADTLVYLCLGSEARQSHYRVFSRASERLLVLYQESSPLSGDEAPPCD